MLVVAVVATETQSDMVIEARSGDVPSRLATDR